MRSFKSEEVDDIIRKRADGWGLDRLGVLYKTGHRTIRRILSANSSIEAQGSPPNIQPGDLSHVKQGKPAKTIPLPEDVRVGGRIEGTKRFVISCVLNDCDLHPFADAVDTYCSANNAELIILPVAYKNISLYEAGDYQPVWPSRYHAKYLTQDIQLTAGLQIIGTLRVQATAKRPLTGLFGLGGTDSIIIGHPRKALHTLASPTSQVSPIQATTGTLSVTSYSQTRDGRLAEFHHVNSALVVETDGEHFWWRYITAGPDGSCIDLDRQYFPSGKVLPAPPAEAIIGGDTHVGHHSPAASHATYTRLSRLTKAKKLVANDLLDSFSISHHHRNKTALRALKNVHGQDNLYEELKQVLLWAEEYLDPGPEFHVLVSNHHEHLDRWLDTPDSGVDPSNLYLWHRLNADRIEASIMQNKLVSAFPLALQLAYSKLIGMKHNPGNWLFSSDVLPLTIGRTAIIHGDKGPSGTRGSTAGYARVAHKIYKAHDHSPAILDGCTSVGDNTVAVLPYSSGFSKTLRCSGIIYSDFTDTLLPIISGRMYIDDTAYVRPV